MIKGDATAGEVLRSFIERIERLNEEIKALNADKSEVFKEAKGTGFDAGAMREVIKLRAMDYEKRNEREELVELYLSAIGTPIALVRAPARDEAA